MWQALGKHRHGPNILSILAQHSANVNARTRDGESVLHFAIASGDPARVSLLLRLGARPTSEDVEEAASYGYAAMAAELRGALVM
jgi:ankyrin repeat protein